MDSVEVEGKTFALLILCVITPKKDAEKLPEVELLRFLLIFPDLQYRSLILSGDRDGEHCTRRNLPLPLLLPPKMICEQSREPFVGMPLAGTPAPVKRKKSTKLIGKLTHEVMPQEVSKLNLGKKISIPRDVMLEELSLLTNKGSKMFKLRQLRVEKFIYENNPDAFTDNSVDHFQKFIPPGGHYGGDADGYAQGRMVGGVTAGQHGSSKQQYPGAPPRPGSKGGPGDSEGERAGDLAGSGGEGGDGTDKDGKSGGKKVTIFKTYISPWERAMGISPEDKSQFTIDLLSYSPKADFPHYKSFNRTAMPYGGYEKAAKRMTFKVPQFDICPLLPESLMIYNQNFSNRPSFNRTPIPWMPSGDSSEYHTEVNVPRSGETEEL